MDALLQLLAEPGARRLVVEMSALAEMRMLAEQAMPAIRAPNTQPLSPR